MKAVILAAGYANRMREVTNNGEIPKTLLPIKVGGRSIPILYTVLDKINAIAGVDEILIVANDKYQTQIAKACKNYSNSSNIKIVSDGSSSPENAKGANVAIKIANEMISFTNNQPVLIIASDNVFSFDLNEMVQRYNDLAKKGKVNVLTSKLYSDEDREYIANNLGILDIAPNGRVNGLDEKPGLENLKTNCACWACYIFNREDLFLIDEYLSNKSLTNKERDNLGCFISYVIKKTKTYAYEINGDIIDIGTPQQYFELIKNPTKTLKG